MGKIVEKSPKRTAISSLSTKCHIAGPIVFFGVKNVRLGNLHIGSISRQTKLNEPVMSKAKNKTKVKRARSKTNIRKINNGKFV